MDKQEEQEECPLWVQPLLMPSLEHDIKDYTGQIFNFENRLIQEICTTGDDCSEDVIEIIKKKIKQLESTESVKLFAIPNEAVFLKKIIWPLRHAKIECCLNHNLGCIALCGMVCEMVVVFIYDLFPPAFLSHFNNKKKLKEGEIFYEKWRQSERINKLSEISEKIDLLPNEDKYWAMSLFEKMNNEKFVYNLKSVSQKRNSYLHALSYDVTALDNDAISVYGMTFEVVNHIFPFWASDKGMYFPAYFEVYLRKKGIISKVET